MAEFGACSRNAPWAPSESAFAWPMRGRDTQTISDAYTSISAAKGMAGKALNSFQKRRS